MHTANELCLTGKRHICTCTRLHANKHTWIYTDAQVQAQNSKYDIHVYVRIHRKILFPAPPEGISSTRRAGLKQDVGITARI